jgi:hypothetical protein
VGFYQGGDEPSKFTNAGEYLAKCVSATFSLNSLHYVLPSHSVRDFPFQAIRFRVIIIIVIIIIIIIIFTIIIIIKNYIIIYSYI